LSNTIFELTIPNP